MSKQLPSISKTKYEAVIPQTKDWNDPEERLEIEAAIKLGQEVIIDADMQQAHIIVSRFDFKPWIPLTKEQIVIT